MSPAFAALRAVVMTMALAATTAAGALEVRQFATPDDEARFKHLVEELRCLVCQNQTIADSNAELARDLRREVHEMIEAGNSDDDIVTFMVERYGDFVLYRPPVNAVTIALWVGPFVLMAAALGGLLAHLRARRARAGAQVPPLDQDADARVAALVGKPPEGAS